MRYRFFLLALLLLIVLVAILASCAAPSLCLITTPTPTATPHQPTVITVATPTPAYSLRAALRAAMMSRPVGSLSTCAPAGRGQCDNAGAAHRFLLGYHAGGGQRLHGFLWDTDGHIVTNYHVIEGAQQIEVSFGGDTSLPATVVGADPVNDLAVIRVDAVPEGVQPVEVGTSTDLHVGQTAIVIGNPFGQFDRTMTVGIVTRSTAPSKPTRPCCAVSSDRRRDQPWQLRRARCSIGAAG